MYARWTIERLGRISPLPAAWKQTAVYAIDTGYAGYTCYRLLRAVGNMSCRLHWLEWCADIRIQAQGPGIDKMSMGPGQHFLPNSAGSSWRIAYLERGP